MAKKISILVIGVILLCVVAALMMKKEADSVSDGSPDEALLKVVTTTTMVTDMVAVIGGERISVEGLMGPDANPHQFALTGTDEESLKGASLIFYNGHQYEASLQGALEGNEKAFAVTKAVEDPALLKSGDAIDPHIWGNPEVWANCVDVVVEQLSKADPDGADEYELRADMYYDDLVALHEWTQKRVNEIPEANRILVTAHDSFAYFGHAYGIQIKKPTDGATAPLDSSLLAESTAKPGDSVTANGETYDKGTYIGMFKHNVNLVVEALKKE